jgi:hypothetical protein
MSLWRAYFLSWALILGYVAGVVLLSLAQILLAEAGLVTYFQSLPCLLLFIIGGLVGMWVALARVNDPRPLREARQAGLPATGRVLAVKWTGWRDKRRWFTRHPRRFQAAIELEISRAGDAPYRATLLAFILGDQEPWVGDEIQVKIHRHRPEVVVLNQELPHREPVEEGVLFSDE